MKGLDFVEPMKARLVERPPPGDWVYEIKLDGFRTLALKSGREVRLLSRNNKDFVGRFPDVAEAIAELPVREAILDGEIVALESSGRTSFQLLQAYDIGEERPPIVFYAFDLLRLNGRDLTREPLMERKKRLEKILLHPPENIRYSASLDGNVEKLLHQARKLGLEGLIGKRKDSPYEIGKRTGAWIKLKIGFEQEFVIGGYTNPQGSRKCFGSIVAGYYKNGSLMFAGKIGTGFTEVSLRDLYRKLQTLLIPSCPFANLPEKKGSRYSPGLTASEMRKCHWVKPKLLCQVRFAEWTRDGKLRQPVFLGLREDKPPNEVVREIAV